MYGGELDGVSLNDLATVKNYARHVQLGEIFKFDHVILKSNSVFHNSPRGWFTSTMLHLLLFSFSNIFGMVQKNYLDVFAGIDPNLDSQVKFEAFQKLRDPITKKQII